MSARPEVDPAGLVLLAGEDMWPELEAIAHWGPLVERIVILYAYGGEEPGASADRLRHFALSAAPRAQIDAAGPVGDDEAASTASVLRNLPALDGPYFVVGSGGTRSQYTGALLACQSRGDMMIVHRQTPDVWHLVDADASFTLLGGLDARALDRFSVRELLDVTWGGEERRVHLDAGELPRVAERWAKTCIDGTPWRECFAGFTKDLSREQRDLSHGHAFEVFVAALLRGLGVQADDVSVGVRLRDDGRDVQEIDVIVNSAGRLHVIDCKLTGADDKRQALLGTQIREAETTRRWIGDGCGQLILLRPNRRIPDEFLALARQADVRVVDEAALAERDLAEVLSMMLRTPGAAAARSAVAAAPPKPRIDLTRPMSMHEALQASGRSWADFGFGSDHLLVCRLAEKSSAEQFRLLVQEVVGSSAEVVRTTVSISGKTGQAVLAPIDHARLRDVLERKPDAPW